MREILFRAWDKVSKKYREFDGMHDTMKINEDGKVEYYNLQNGSGGDEYILEQFTGLLDKHGRKIFEGDIIEYPPQRKKFIVEFHNDCFGARDKKDKRTRIGSGDDFIIIGNIHDNPELLK